MAYSYVLKYNPHHPVGQRVIAEEHNDLTQTVVAIPLKENQLFGYVLANGLTNHDFNGQHFYLECLPEIGVAHLYFAEEKFTMGQYEYGKTGNPILSSQ